MLPTLPLLVAVAVTLLPEIAPVVKPSANTPEKVPFAALTELAAVAATAVMPDCKLANAAATSAEVQALVAVNVKPFKLTF